MADIPAHVEQALNNLVLDTLTTIRKDVDNLVSAALEVFALHAVRKVLNRPEMMSQVLDAVINNLGFITLYRHYSDANNASVQPRKLSLRINVGDS